MAGPLGPDLGGIQGLLSSPRDLWEAIEADLLDKGFTLADIPGRVTWRALHAMVRRSRHGTAVFREIYGDAASWGPMEHIGATQIDVLNTIAWLTSDTNKNKRPAPVKRPGVQEPQGAKFGGKESAVPESEFWAKWNADLPAIE